MGIFKVEVNPETSKLVQTLLFSKGYYWDTAKHNEIKYTDMKYICPWEDKTICHSSRYYDGDLVLTIDEFIEWINTGKIPEKTFKFTLDYDLTLTVNKKGIVIGGRSYDKHTAIEIANKILELMK